MFTDYELGQTIRAIEAVSRGERPLVELSCRFLGCEEAEQLGRELSTALRFANEPGVRAYILELGHAKYAYGFYSAPWVIKARLYLESQECPGWLRGLVFGEPLNSMEESIHSDQQSASPQLHDPSKEVSFFQLSAA